MNFRSIFIASLFFVSFIGKSQNTYSVSQSRGCVPYTVNVTGNTNNSNPIFILFFENQPIDTLYTLNFSFQVLSVGGYRIRFTVDSSGTGILSSTNILITGLESSAPSISGFVCANRVANIRIVENKFDFYTIAWGDGTTQTTTGNSLNTKTYPNTNTRNITVTGIYIFTINGVQNSCSNSVVTTLTPQDILSEANFNQLKVQSLSPSAGTATLTASDLNPQFNYQISYRELGSTIYSNIDTLSNTSGTFTTDVGGLNTADKIYEFRYRTFDQCGNTTTGTSIFTLPARASASRENNTLVVGQYLGAPALYTVTVNGSILERDRFVVPSTEIEFIDENVQCRVNYCYTAEAFNSSTNKRSISAEVCVEGQKPSNFSPLVGVNSTYDGSRVRVFWPPYSVPGVNYRVLAEIGSDTIFSDNTTSNSIIPQNQNTNCYYVQVQDRCGTSLPSKTCPIRLTGQKDNLVQNSLNYTNYINSDNSTISNIIVELQTDRGEFIENLEGNTGSNTFLHNPINEQHQVVVYKIIATLDDAAGTQTSSNTVAIKQDVRLFVPTAFSPNGDRLNDVFFPKGLFWDKFEMNIYNRWGQSVFYTDNKNEGWGGENHAPGLYHVVITVKDKFGETIVQKTTLELTR